jgi:outer membrane lipoprotein-sorting protein
MATDRILHSPTLESVQMVERTIKKHSQEYGKYQLWKRLPKKMMYQTYLTILDYLQESGKIMVAKGKVFWTYDPKTVRKLISQGLVLR